MKVVIQTGYGTADVMELREIEKPAPGDGEVLVRVLAASLAAGDYFGMRGMPFPIRMFVGFPKPKKDYVVGADLAGVVAAVGRNVTRFKPGDEVFGECSRACADYACAREDRLVRKPHDLTFEQAEKEAGPAVQRTATKAAEVQGLMLQLDAMHEGQPDQQLPRQTRRP